MHYIIPSMFMFISTSGQLRKAQPCSNSTLNRYLCSIDFIQLLIAVVGCGCSGQGGLTRTLCGPRLLLDSMLFTEELQECATIRPNGQRQQSCCAATGPSGGQLSEKPPLHFTLQYNCRTSATYCCPTAEQTRWLTARRAV